MNTEKRCSETLTVFDENGQTTYPCVLSNGHSGDHQSGGSRKAWPRVEGFQPEDREIPEFDLDRAVEELCLGWLSEDQPLDYSSVNGSFDLGEDRTMVLLNLKSSSGRLSDEEYIVIYNGPDDYPTVYRSLQRGGWLPEGV